MQRKQLIEAYKVDIYAVTGGYILVIDGLKKKFKFMTEIEDYLSENKGKKYVRKY